MREEKYEQKEKRKERRAVDEKEELRREGRDERRKEKLKEALVLDLHVRIPKGGNDEADVFLVQDQLMMIDIRKVRKSS